MAKTPEAYLEDFKLVHGDVYTYERFVETFQGSQNKASVTCPLHGTFEISPVNHGRGQGCRSCGVLRRSKAKKHSYEDFKNISNRVHYYKYTYLDNPDFTGDRSRVEIVCDKHGVFEMLAVSHKQGRGCGKCSHLVGYAKRTHTNDSFIAKAQEIHGTKYDYSKVEYIGDKINVDIVCNLHGPFQQLPQNHKQGSGCPSCSDYGFNKNIPSYLYVLYSEGVVKLGITNRNPEKRRSKISSESPYDFKILTYVYFPSGEAARDLEQRTLKVIRASYPNPHEKFDGCTECFTGIDPSELVSEIINQMKEGAPCQ